MEQQPVSLIKTENMSSTENNHSPERPIGCIMEQGQNLADLDGDISVHILKQDLKAENMFTTGSVNLVQNSDVCANESGHCCCENIISTEHKNIYRMPQEAEPYIKSENKRFSDIYYTSENTELINEQAIRSGEISVITVYDEKEMLKVRQQQDISPLIKTEKKFFFEASILPETVDGSVNEKGQCISKNSCYLQEGVKNRVSEDILPFIKNEVTTSIGNNDLPQKSNEHMLTQTGERSECNKSFKTASKQKRHARTYSDQKPHKCNECKKSFKRASHLKVHTMIHSGEKPYSCCECSKSFITREKLKRHTTTHSNEKSYKCEECKKCFSTSSNLIVHSMIHSGEKPYQCLECNVWFSYYNSFQSHMLTHTGEKPYTCPECSRSFTTASYLKVHARIHSGEKPYRCKECDKCYYRANHLKRHMLIHTGIKSYTCPECNKSFTTGSNLKMHARIHTGEKPYMCKECHKCFCQAINLKMHVLTHTGEKPYMCPDCSRSFTTASGLKVHARIHSNEKPNRCQEF